MNLTPDPSWPLAALAAMLLADAALSIRPPEFIRKCLTGVGFPREWWWALVVIKVLAAGGLIVGIYADGIGLAATVGVIAYFLCATWAHVRMRFLGSEFWLNCLGMLASASAVLVVSFVA